MLLIRVTAPEQTTRYVGPLLAALVAAATWLLVARGRIQAGVYMLTIGAWVVVTGIALFFGGVRAVIIFAYPVSIILTGWLIGARAALTVAGITVAVIAGFVLGEAAGVLPKPPPTSAGMFAVVQILIIALSAALIFFLVRAYKNRHLELSAMGNTLAARSAELEARTAELHRAQAVAQVGSWAYEIAGDTMRLSAETCRIFGVPDGTYGNHDTYLASVHAQDRNAVEGAWQASLKGTAFDHEHRIVVAGATRWVRQSAEIELGTDGTALRAVGIVQDITARKQAEVTRISLEAQLRESQKMQAIGTLAGGIAHDFNNIIATILGNVELARQDAGANAPVLESLEEIRKSGTRARDLVQQILSFSRREPTRRRLLALAPVVEEAARLLRATLPARIALEIHCDAAAPTVLADKTQIEQVLINLATNAMQAMRAAPGRIDIHLESVLLDTAVAQTHPALLDLFARRPGRAVRLTVSDNGPGMDASTLTRVFEPFFTTKPVGEGTGLGLSVVHGIVQAHEGAIVVNSAPDQGASFALYLPEAPLPDRAEEHAQGATPAAIVAPGGASRQIL